ncbi:MAG: hypothetical protein IKN00_04340 [Bacteroidales bacterium]|nr:hypothetical protein [Bacteroidales bacterium]
MSEYMNQEIGWDDSISKDSEFTILPEGDYSFTVAKFERARHNGSEKLPPCNKAVLTLELTDGVHSGTITHNLFLHRKTEGMLCAFFSAIGQRKHGETLAPKWNQVIGSTGTCKVGMREWTGRDGQKMQSNEIRRFYEKEAAPEAAPAAPAANSGYTPGKF